MIAVVFVFASVFGYEFKIVFGVCVFVWDYGFECGMFRSCVFCNFEIVFVVCVRRVLLCLVGVC